MYEAISKCDRCKSFNLKVLRVVGDHQDDLEDCSWDVQVKCNDCGTEALHEGVIDVKGGN